MKRRDFLTHSSLAGGLALASWPGGALEAQGSPREFYELRVYEMQTGNRKAVRHDYLENACLPALNRLGIKPVGVFSVVSGAGSMGQYVLIPHPDLRGFLTTPGRLAEGTVLGSSSRTSPDPMACRPRPRV